MSRGERTGTALLAALGLVAVPFAYDAFYHSRLMASPHRPAIETLAAGAGPDARVIVGDQDAFDTTYAFLQRRFDVTSVQTDWWYPDWEPRLGSAILGHPPPWVYAPAASPRPAGLAERYPSLAIHDGDDWQLSGWDTR